MIAKLFNLLQNSIRSPRRALAGAYGAFNSKNGSVCPHSALPSLPAAPNRVTKPVCHIACFQPHGNAGDTLLPVCIQDAFRLAGVGEFDCIGARDSVSLESIRRINQNGCVVIGGGGLFLRDTNPNPHSGWQWPCPVELIEEIDTPLFLFAVGYNRFRDQPDFDPIFKTHVNALAQKSEFIGLRNHGSINALREYLDPELHFKVRYQPCLTTVLSKIYPEYVKRSDEIRQRPKIGVNCAFDRPGLRYGKDELSILTEIGKALRELSMDADIYYLLHDEKDIQFLPFLRGAEVDFEVLDMAHMQSPKIIKSYSDLDFVLGMRGHAQLIPFGCRVPTLSLISHDKLQWFLSDIGHEEWGLDLRTKGFNSKIVVEKSLQMLGQRTEIISQIDTVQCDLWETSLSNIEEICTSTKS